MRSVKVRSEENGNSADAVFSGAVKHTRRTRILSRFFPPRKLYLHRMRISARRRPQKAKKEHGPIPESWAFGDDIDWTGDLERVSLHVELPFWLMMPEGTVKITWSEVDFDISVLQMQMEVFNSFFTDSRSTRIAEDPLRPEFFMYPDHLIRFAKKRRHLLFPRMCKTVLALDAMAHPDAFKEPTDTDRPAVARQHELYWQSLCEAHIPVVNELIQRYRYTSYDYFPYEVSAWDVPVWTLIFQERQCRAVLIPYRDWDQRPFIVEVRSAPEVEPTRSQFSWTDASSLQDVKSSDASPGEYDLLDARSLMERGDYTGAIRRTVTAMEALVGWKLRIELEKRYPETEVDSKLYESRNDYPGRYKQWKKLSGSAILAGLERTFEDTRQLRHEIVHRGRRLTFSDRHQAQFAVDSGRWLYNSIEALPTRTSSRESGALKSAGRVMIQPRFPSSISPQGLTLGPFVP
jgi:hypothetical protein